MDAICNVCGAVTVISAEEEDPGRELSRAPFACASCGEYGTARRSSEGPAAAEPRPTPSDGPGSGATAPPLRRPLPCTTRDDDDPTMVDLRSIIMKSLAAVAASKAPRPREGDEEIQRVPSRHATLLGWPPAPVPQAPEPPVAASTPPEVSGADVQAPESVRQIARVCDSLVPVAPASHAPGPRREWRIALAAATSAASLAAAIGIRVGSEGRPQALTAGMQQLAADAAWALLPKEPPSARCPTEPRAAVTPDAQAAVTPGARPEVPVATPPATPTPPVAAARAPRPGARSAPVAATPAAAQRPAPAAPEAPKSVEQTLAEAMAAAVGASPPKRVNRGGSGSGDSGRTGSDGEE